jgi:NAD(P) transhydrogenase subunit beta
MVIKRGRSAGFAGIENPLYYLDRTLMRFGDAIGFVANIVRGLTGSGHG